MKYFATEIMPDVNKVHVIKKIMQSKSDENPRKQDKLVQIIKSPHTKSAHLFTYSLHLSKSPHFCRTNSPH